MKKSTAIQFAIACLLGGAALVGCEVNNPPDTTVTPPPTVIHENVHTPPSVNINPPPQVNITPPSSSTHTETHTQTTVPPVGAPATTGTETTTTG